MTDAILDLICPAVSTMPNPYMESSKQECSNCKTPVWLADEIVQSYAGNKVKLYCVRCSTKLSHDIQTRLDKRINKDVEKILKLLTANKNQLSPDPGVQVYSLLRISAHTAAKFGCPLQMFLQKAEQLYKENYDITSHHN